MEQEQIEVNEMRVRYLLSFLMILVHRAGGELSVEKLSEYAGREITLNMELQKDRDRVILKTIEPKKSKH